MHKKQLKKTKVVHVTTTRDHDFIFHTEDKRKEKNNCHFLDSLNCLRILRQNGELFIDVELIGKARKIKDLSHFKILNFENGKSQKNFNIQTYLE